MEEDREGELVGLDEDDGNEGRGERGNGCGWTEFEGEGGRTKARRRDGEGKKEQGKKVRELLFRPTHERRAPRRKKSRGDEKLTF